MCKLRMPKATTWKIGIIAGLLAIGLSVVGVYAAVQGTMAVAVVDSTNSTRYYNVPGDQTSGMWVNVKNESVTVIQPTGSNLNATVNQSTGSNLHVQTDTGSTTACTQSDYMVLQTTATPTVNIDYPLQNDRVLYSTITSTNIAIAGSYVLFQTPTSQTERVYGISLSNGANTANTVKLKSCGASDCTSCSDSTSIMSLGTNYPQFNIGPSTYPLFIIGGDLYLCVVTSASTTVGVNIWHANDTY